MAWINTKDRVPESSTEVLTFWDNNYFEILCYDSLFGQWRYPNGMLYRGESITHWTPLPSPPQEAPKEVPEAPPEPEGFSPVENAIIVECQKWENHTVKVCNLMSEVSKFTDGDATDFHKALTHLIEAQVIERTLEGDYKLLKVPSEEQIKTLIFEAVRDGTKHKTYIGHRALFDHMEDHGVCGRKAEEILRDGVLYVEHSPYYGYRITEDKKDHLSEIPEPWQGVVRKINPSDAFLIFDGPSGTHHVHRFDGETTAKEMGKKLEDTPFSGMGRMTTGVSLRNFILKLVEAIDEVHVPVWSINLKKP